MWNREFLDTLGGMKKRYLMALVTVVLTTPAIASCASSSTTKDTVAIMSLTPVSQVIDVRTPEEFAAGHVQGATNLDVESGAFEAALAGLDKEAPFTLYCRSGRRSAIAADLMAKAGFTQVTDLGTLESAATSLSLPIVTN
jgi:phage shock protein E